MGEQLEVKIKVVCEGLPGTPLPDSPPGAEVAHRDIYLGIQRGDDIIDLARANQKRVVFEPSFRVLPLPEDKTNFLGPFAKGTPRQRFFYLSWAVMSAEGELTMIRLLNGSLPACPDLWFGVVDVRDVADLHLRAMTAPEAKGERFIATQSGAVSMLEIAKVLKARLGEEAKRVPTRKLPNFIVRFIALFNIEMRDLVPLLGKARNATSAKAQRMLGWKPRRWEEAIIATAESLLKLGAVEAK